MISSETIYAPAFSAGALVMMDAVLPGITATPALLRGGQASAQFLSPNPIKPFYFCAVILPAHSK